MRNANVKGENPIILGIEVWSSKGVQKVLNQISRKDIADFDQINADFREILSYPGLWDLGNYSRFLDVFNPFVKKHHKDDEKRLSLIGTWRKFDDLKAEQEFSQLTISVEEKVANRLSGEGRFAHGFAQGIGGAGAYSIK